MSSAFEGLPKTPNLKLNKPGYDNVADIEALNENADILDEEIQGIKNTFVKSVNGKEPDAGGNVNVEEYTHPNSGVTAGTYRSVTVNAQGHVTAGSNPTLDITNGGTGATTASKACANIGALPTSGGTMRGNITFEDGGSLGSKDGYLTMNGRVLGVQNGDYPVMQNQINLSMLPATTNGQFEYEYVAPATGWLCINGVSTSTYSSLWLYDNAFKNDYGIGIPAARSNVRMQITLPVIKGRTYLLKFESCKEVKGVFWYTSEEEW